METRILRCMNDSGRTYQNRLKDDLAAGAATVGGWMCTASAGMAEALATLGFDWIAVDMEHTATGLADAEAIFVVCERYRIAPLVRLPEADPILARRLLDIGGHGFIVPQVEDAGDLADFAAHLFYAPEGKRGVCLSRMNAWGDDFADYHNGFRPVIVPQIESARGITNVGDIAGQDFVDAVFLGPYDLSADLGCPGDFKADEFTAAVARYRKACSESCKPMGIHQVDPDTGALRERIDEGYRFIAYGTDTVAARKALGGVRDLKKG